MTFKNKPFRIFFIIFYCITTLSSISSAGEIVNFGRQNGCNYDKSASNEPIYGYKSTTEARQVVFRIAKAMGITPTFVVLASNVPNASADIKNNKRYILYNPEFIKKVSTASSNWGALTIMAHEIGHHVNSHLLLAKEDESYSGQTRKNDEIAADYFSGRVIRYLGGTEQQAVLALKDTVEEESENYPSVSARRQAIIAGWQHADEQIINVSTPTTSSKELIANVQGLLNGMEFFAGNDYGKVSDQTKMAASAFQRVYGLEIDGKINPALQNALRNAKSNGFSNKTCVRSKTEEEVCEPRKKTKQVPIEKYEQEEISSKIPCHYNIQMFCNWNGCNFPAIEQMCENQNNGRQILRSQCRQQGGKSISGFDILCDCGTTSCTCDIDAKCRTKTQGFEIQTYFVDECSPSYKSVEKCDCKAPEVCKQSRN